MTQIDNGGPAFPLAASFNDHKVYGMSLRDWFAGQALTAVIRRGGAYLPSVDDTPEDYFARAAYAQADAMIAARRKP